MYVLLFCAETFGNRTEVLELCYFSKNPEDTAQSKGICMGMRK